MKLPNLTTINDSIREHMSVVRTIREKASLKSMKSAQQEVDRHAANNPPSMYSVGDKVLIQVDNKKSNKMKGKGISVKPCHPGIVVDCNTAINKYKVKADVEGKEFQEWVSVSKISSVTRAEESRRERNVDGMLYYVS